MNLVEFKEKINNEVMRYAKPSGNKSRAFLKWFLVNYFRIDEDIASDYICDNRCDKGIDGIYSDDLSSEIFIFQSKYTENPGSNQGDSDLKKFDGVKAWFQSPKNIQSLDNSLANQELKAMVNRLALVDKIVQEYKISLVFVTNKVFDTNATEYLGVVGEYYDAWDLNRLFDTYTYAGKDKPVPDKFSFFTEGKNIICHSIPNGIEAWVFAAKGSDIVKLKGIQDGTLFDRNVRYGLGKTRINREIVAVNNYWTLDKS